MRVVLMFYGYYWSLLAYFLNVNLFFCMRSAFSVVYEKNWEQSISWSSEAAWEVINNQHIYTKDRDNLLFYEQFTSFT